MRQQRIIGVLGGMGPEATIDLFAKIVGSTPASRDQDHLRIIVDNNPEIPDRQKAILENGPSPAPLLVKTARNLEAAGADFIVMPCNTAHYWIEEIRKAVKIPVIDMIEETAKYVAENYPAMRIVGILAATGTVRSGLYQRQLSRVMTKTTIPSDEDQAAIMRAIYSVKGGDMSESRATALKVGRRLIEAGAGGIVAGCTEIPLVLKTGDFPIPIVDATQVLASRAVEVARHSGPI